MKNPTIAYFLLIMLLIQSCVAYQKTSVPLDRAHDQGKGKSIYNGKDLKFDNIYFEYGVYYLTKRQEWNSKGYYEKLESKEIFAESSMKSIHLKDKQKSKNRTVAAVAGGILGLGFVFLIIIALNSDIGGF